MAFRWKTVSKEIHEKSPERGNHVAADAQRFSFEDDTDTAAASGGQPL